MPKFCFARFFAIAALLLALAAAPHSSAQQSVLPDRFGSWSASSPVSELKPEDRPEQLKETGFVNSPVRSYSSAGRTLTVALFHFHDPSSAYEIYTSRISPDMNPSTVGPHTGVDQNKLLALVGNVVVEIWPPQSPSTQELAELLKFIRASSDLTPLPPIRTYLPEGFAGGTQRYALGPAGFQAAVESLHRSEYSRLAPEAGFKSGAEAMFAHYHSGKDDAVLLLIEYPTPQLAGLHLKHLEQALSSEAKQAGTTIERKASLLSIVLAPTSAKYAQSLRNAVNYETQVTWNEPTHTLTDPPIVTTVAKIILTTGVLMVVAFVLGMAFGGVRLLTKIFFPGKVFDRPDQMDVLQLGLSSKSINSRDFY